MQSRVFPLAICCCRCILSSIEPLSFLPSLWQFAALNDNHRFEQFVGRHYCKHKNHVIEQHFPQQKPLHIDWWRHINTPNGRENQFGEVTTKGSSKHTFPIFFWLAGWRSAKLDWGASGRFFFGRQLINSADSVPSKAFFFLRRISQTYLPDGTYHDFQVPKIVDRWYFCSVETSYP